MSRDSQPQGVETVGYLRLDGMVFTTGEPRDENALHWRAIVYRADHDRLVAEKDATLEAQRIEHTETFFACDMAEKDLVEARATIERLTAELAEARGETP